MSTSYLALLRRRLAFVIFLTVVGLGASPLFAATRPESFRASLSLSINRIHRQETPDYQYDGYYAIQASDLVAQTVVSWMATPSMLREVYTQAGLDPGDESLDAFKGRFRTRKFSAQNIVVEFTEGTRANAEKVAAALVAVIQERNQALNRSAEGEALFEVAGSTPVIVPAKPNTPLLAVLGAVTGLLLAAALVGVQYVWGSRSQEEG